MTRIFAISFIAAFFLFSCYGPFRKPSQTEINERPSQKGLKYDPLGLPEDTVVIPLSAEMAGSSDIDSIYAYRYDEADSDIIDEESGGLESYRIQLFTSKTYGPAAREARIAREVFDRQIYLDYEVPYYKVRIGDFADPRDAETYLVAARQAGYETAWVVRVITNIEALDNIYNDDLPPLIEDRFDETIIPEMMDDSIKYKEN